MMRTMLWLAAIAAGVLLLHPDTAFAQQQKAGPKAESKAAAKGAAVAPKVGDKFGDWTYQCDEQPGGAAPSCYLSQSRVSTNERGEQNRVLLVNLSKIGDERQPVLFIFLPFGAAVQQDVVVTADASNTGLKGRVDTCVLSGCRVPFLLAADAQDLLRKAKTLWVSFAPVGGNNVRVEIPLNGFTAGLAALN